MSSSQRAERALQLALRTMDDTRSVARSIAGAADRIHDEDNAYCIAAFHLVSIREPTNNNRKWGWRFMDGCIVGNVPKC